MPEVGEIVAYHTPEGETVFAHVVDVIFWDLVDLKLGDGTILRNVRRTVITFGGSIVAQRGRFDRIGDRE